MEAWVQVLGSLFVLALPLFLIGASVAWAINDPGLYQRGFVEYGVSRQTGIPPQDLTQAGAQIRRYFNTGVEPLAVTAQVWGQDKDLFNAREVHHMGDVKVLVRGVYLVAGGALAYLLGTIIGGLAGIGPVFFRRLAWWSFLGGILTLTALLAVGLLAVVGFESLFRVFHQLSFSNDLWQLDPRRDYLLMMFPLGFWFDATLRVAAAAALSASVITAIAGIGLLTSRKPGRAGFWRGSAGRNRRSELASGGGRDNPPVETPSGGSGRRSNRRRPWEAGD